MLAEINTFDFTVLTHSFGHSIETGFAPAAYHALGWGPVGTSTVLGLISLLLFGFMIIVYVLSAKGISDEMLVIIGNSTWIVGGTMLYFMWVAKTQAWKFVIPVVVCISGMPFIAAPNRSLFAQRVDANPALEVRSALMQALLSMFSSVAGVVMPSFVAAFILRKPEEVEASQSHRELNPLALCIIVGPMITILGVIYVSIFKPLGKDAFGDDNEDEEVDAEEMADEVTSLVLKRTTTIASRRSSAFVLAQKADHFTEANRRMSALIMGIPQIDNPRENRRRSSVFAQISAGLAHGKRDSHFSLLGN
jgi:glucan phosphoethanolaminetransferase (alkaline phosphatase superfamily)